MDEGDATRAAVTAAADGVVILDETLTHVSVNPAYTDLHGYDDPAELVGEPWRLCCPDGPERFDTEIEPSLAADGEWRGTLSGHHRDGTAFTLSVSVAPLDDGGVVCVVREANDRVDAEPSAILDRMTDAFFAVDEEWTISYLNDEAATVLSTAMDDPETGDSDEAASDDRRVIEGRTLWEAIPDLLGTVFETEYRTAMSSQEPRTFEAHYGPLDTWFEVRAYPSNSGLSIYFRDITERREREATLAERERVLSEMYEVSADVDRSLDAQIEALLDIGREVLDVSYGTLSRIDGEDYVFEVVSTDDDSIREGDVTRVSATNCERTAATEETLVLGDVASDAPELTDKDGYEEWGISCYLGAPVMVEGAVYGTFCFYDEDPRSSFSEWEVTLVDLMAQWVSYERTHAETRRRLQRKNAQLERQNQRLEEFVSIVSHDLRNPLSILDGWLEQAEQTGDSDHFQRCYDAVDRMETLIDELLTLARAGEQITELETVDLADLAAESWAGVETADASLTVEATKSLQADRSRLEQLLKNLLRNAVEHGGHDVRVTVSDTDDGFAVSDDGPGIPEENRSEVFDAGFSTGDTGTGFGLKIVRQVADAHGWTLEVTDSPAGGARFEFGDVDRR